MAVAAIPEQVSLESVDAERMLILDGISDLGELGTIIRSAAGFDWQMVWITHSCGDPFDPVCIRSSQGALFSLPYKMGSLDNALKHARRTPGITKLRYTHGQRTFPIRLGVLHADLTESNLPIRDTGKFCLLVQRPYETVKEKGKSDVGITDFRRVGIAGLKDPALLPLSVAGSTLLHIIQSRYFS
jgi:hypothetical protein